MKCVKCGNELQPGARFCVYCGTPAAASMPQPTDTTPSPADVTATPVTPEPSATPEPPAAPVTPAAPDPYQQPYSQQTDPYQQPYGQQTNPYQQQSAPQQQWSPIPEEPKKSGKKGVGAIVAVFVVLILVLVASVGAIFVVKGGKSTASTENQLTYVKNGKLYYKKDIRKDDDAVVVCSVKNWDEASNASSLSGTFSNDGTYLYFYNKVEDGTAGRLCRVQVSKLKDDEDKNEDLIEELVSGVAEYTLIDDNCFVYLNASDELYYYDGEEKNKIASDINYYYCSGNDRVAFYTNSNEMGYYSISEDSKQIVIENCSYFIAGTDNGYYTADYDSDDYRYDLYYSTEDGESELVVADTYAILGNAEGTDKLYYVVERTENVCYYDLVNDIYAEADESAAEPSLLDCLTPCTEYDAMSDWEREYYTNYPEDISYFYEWLSTDTYYGTGMKYNFSSGTDADGNYVYNYYFYDEANTQWYVFDEDAYDAAYAAYETASDRISLREELKASTIDISTYDLCVWTPDDGQTVVASNVSPYQSILLGGNGIVVYQKYGEIGKVDWPEEAYSVWFVEDYVYDCRYGEDTDSSYYYNMDGTETAWDSAWGDLGDSSTAVSFSASEDGKQIIAKVSSFDDDYNYTIMLSAFSVEDGTLSMVERDFATATSGMWVDADHYYYVEKESDSEGNLCCYSDGKTSTILKGISYTTVLRYENGSYSAYSDYDASNGGTLKIYNADGDSTKIDSDVSSYCYISDDLIVYVRDEKLYVYRGEDEEKFKIDSSVTSYSCSGASYETLVY